MNSGKLREKNFQKKGPVDRVVDETGHRKARCEDQRQPILVTYFLSLISHRLSAQIFTNFSNIGSMTLSHLYFNCTINHARTENSDPQLFPIHALVILPESFWGHYCSKQHPNQVLSRLFSFPLVFSTEKSLALMVSHESQSQEPSPWAGSLCLSSLGSTVDSQENSCLYAADLRFGIFIITALLIEDHLFSLSVFHT